MRRAKPPDVPSGDSEEGTPPPLNLPLSASLLPPAASRFALGLG